MSTTQQEQTRAAAPQEYLLEMRGITKAFAGVQALKGVDFYVRPGTVHALMGENGAGKSTLMKCLFGIYHKDEGTIKLRGQEVNFQSPHEALLNGISMVHQELEQVPERSVMENVWLGRFPKKFGLIDTAKMVKDTEAVLATLGGEVKIDPRARLSSLTVSKRQMVDIAKAVSYNCDIIALDEPTSSLNEKEVDILMGIIDGLRRQGKGIIYISHKMEEIFRIADDITVMRDGALIKTMRAAETNVDEVIRLMVGRELTDRFPPKQGTIGKEILVVKDLNDLGHHIHDISFDLPYTPGHEMAGVIVAVGKGVDPARIGEHISAAIDIVCGECEFCRIGRTNLCRSLVRIGFERDGSHEEYCVIPAKNAFTVDPTIPFEEITGIPDAVGCMYNGLKNQAKLGIGQTLLILGVGGLGMNAIQIAKLMGATVYATSRKADKLEVAKQMGADAVIDTSCEDLRTRVAELTNGRGVDVVLDNIGLEWSINEGVYMVRPGGKVLVCGYISEDFKVNYQEVMKFEKEILGMRGMTRQDMAEVVELVNQRKIVPYVYKTVPFEQINEALGLLRDGKTKGRVVLLFPED